MLSESFSRVGINNGVRGGGETEEKTRNKNAPNAAICVVSASFGCLYISTIHTHTQATDCIIACR